MSKLQNRETLAPVYTMFMLDFNCPRESGNITSHAAEEICFDKRLTPDKPMKLAEQTLFKSKGLYSILKRKSRPKETSQAYWKCIFKLC